MRLWIAVAALTCALALIGAPASAQSVCRPMIGGNDNCQSLELERLRQRVVEWRVEARQSREDAAYFERQRNMCAGDAQCLIGQYQAEIVELQPAIEPTPAPMVARNAADTARVTANLRGLSAQMDAVILADSQGWMLNRYDQGSVMNVRVLERSRDRRSMIIYSEYTFNGGAHGWVKARVLNSVFDCVEYWDFRGPCRPVGAQSYAYGIAAGLAVAALASAATAPSSSCAGIGAC